MKTYTVLLLRPDYIADDFGTDTYLAHVSEENVPRAVWDAQREVWRADNGIEGTEQTPEGTPGHPADYAVLCVIEGHHMDIREEQ